MRGGGGSRDENIAYIRKKFEKTQISIRDIQEFSFEVRKFQIILSVENIKLELIKSDK